MLVELPLLHSLQGYDRAALGADATAGVITAILPVPQAMAYALLAGLPAEAGLYASILPPLVYALLGTTDARFHPRARQRIRTPRAR